MGCFQRRRVITPADIDELDHVNNVVWLGFAVELAMAHSASLGLDMPAYRRIGCVWVARRHEIEYLRSAVLGDEIVEQTWVVQMRAARSIRRARFLAADGRELVHCRMEWAFVDLGSLRPRRVPPEVLERFTPIPDENA
ncbi:MAG: acyl-CoA thioesterase [bacterium]|nr:acyl-CoA thioesterase [bacterium]